MAMLPNLSQDVEKYHQIEVAIVVIVIVNNYGKCAFNELYGQMIAELLFNNGLDLNRETIIVHLFQKLFVSCHNRV